VQRTALLTHPPTHPPSLQADSYGGNALFTFGKYSVRIPDEIQAIVTDHLFVPFSPSRKQMSRCYLGKTIIVSFKILSNSAFTNHSNIGRYVV
jgi:hypothetical protein